MNEVDVKVEPPPPMPALESVRQEEPMREIPETTTMSWFLADITNAPVPMTPELWMLMVEHARQFLSLGQAPDWKDWRVLDAIQRRAWIEAASQLKIRGFLDRAGGLP